MNITKFWLLILNFCNYFLFINYSFVFVDIGKNGSLNDAHIYNQSSFLASLKNGSLHWPPPKVIPGSEYSIPHHLIGDDIFPLSETLMKPYSVEATDSYYEKYTKRIFDYRLSRARLVSENAFGQLVNRHNVFKKPIELKKLETIKDVVMCSVCIHNFLIDSNSSHEGNLI